MIEQTTLDARHTVVTCFLERQFRTYLTRRFASHSPNCCLSLTRSSSGQKSRFVELHYQMPNMEALRHTAFGCGSATLPSHGTNEKWLVAPWYSSILLCNPSVALAFISSIYDIRWVCNCYPVLSAEKD